MEKIDRFADEYFWLSNFADSPFYYKGKYYPTVEHFFQSYKAISEPVRESIRLTNNPSEAKALGRVVMLRNDWEEIKDNVMYIGVYEKFKQNPDLAQKLLDTGNAELIEGNNWRDTYWGICQGVGLNKLGKILMRVRKELGESND